MDKRLIAIFWICFFIGLIIPTVSALEIDNVKSYDPISKEVTVKNMIGLGSDVAKIKLNTPLNLKVARGYQKVAEFDMIYYLDDNGGLDEIDFYNIKNDMSQIDRQFDFKIKEIEKFEVNDYFCTDVFNKLNNSFSKDCVINGSHFEEKEVWKDLDLKNLKKDEKLTIGIFTDVQKGDHVEWIPNFYGVKINEWASWTENLNTDLISYLRCEETTGNLQDATANNYDGTVSGTLPNQVTGFIDYGQDFISASSDVFTMGDLAEIDDGVFTINIWFNPDSWTNNYQPISKNVAGDSGFRFYEKTTAGKNVRFEIQEGANEYTMETTSAIGLNAWNMITILRRANQTAEVYVNGTQMAHNDVTTWKANAQLLTFGRQSATASLYIDGQMDEVAVWDRDLSASEISEIYQAGLSGNGYTTTFDKDPIVTLNNPANNTNFSYSEITFNCTASDDVNLANVSLYLDGVLNETNSSGINNTDYIFSKVLGIGGHNWTCSATDNESQTTTEDYYYLNVTLTPPTITLINPANNTNHTTASIDFICEAYDDIDLVNVSFYLNGNLNETNSSGVNNSNYTFSKVLIDGDYNWTCNGYDSDDESTTADERYLIVDATDPVLSATSNLTDLAVFSLPTNSVWSYNASDLHINQCYYNTSDNATYTIETCNSSITTSWTTDGSKTIKFCANDTFGNEICNTTTISVYYIQTSQTDNPDPIAEGYDAIFNLTINMSSIPITTANLILNNTIYPATRTKSGSDIYYFITTVNIPDGWGNTTGKIINWNWTYNISGVVTNQQTATTNITVYQLAVDNCSSYGEVILNLSLKNEKTNALVNESAGSNVEVDLLLTSKDNQSVYLAYNNTWTNENNPTVCIPLNILNTTDYWIDFTIGFDSTDHVWEFYHLENGTLNSSKQFDAQTDYTIDLMDLLTADSTSFLFNYFDQDGLPVEDIIIHVFRKYIGEGVFYEVERSKANQNGDTVIHLVEEDVIYYFMISQYGVPLYTSSTYTALCQAVPCTIQIEASGGFQEFPTDYDLIDGGAISINSSASTRKVSLIYALNESAKMNFTIYKYNSDGSYSSVTSANETGTSGVIQLSVPMSAGNVSFFVSVWKDDQFIKSEWVDFEAKASDVFGLTLSLLISALIILTLGLIAVTEGVGTIPMVILGVFLSGALGLMTTRLSTGVSIIIYLILAGALILWGIIKRRRK